MPIVNIALAGLLVASQCLPTLASRRFLTSASRTGTDAHAAAVGTLRTEAARLARALRWSLSDAPHAPPQLVEAARERLVQEADHLAGADELGATLLHGFALHAPPAVLLFPSEVVLAGPEANAVPLALPGASDGFVEAPEGIGIGPWLQATSSESQESILNKDGRGHLVTRIRRCKNGRCLERTELGSATRLAAPVHWAAGNNTAEPLAAAVHSMAAQMRRIKEGLGQGGLENIMRNIFEMDDGGRIPQRWPLRQENSTNLTKVRSVKSMSQSAEIIIDNGKVLRRTRECRDGKCVTNVTEGQIEGRSPAHKHDKTKGNSTVVQTMGNATMPL